MKKQVLFIHGGGNFAGISREDFLEELRNKEIDVERLRRKEKWSARLQTDLGEQYDVLAPHMPNSDLPLYEEWKVWFENILTVLDDELIIVGHSLGGMFLLKYFSEETVDKKVLGLFSVAAPHYDKGEEWYERFEKSGFDIGDDLSKVMQVEKVFLYHSTDDVIAPFDQLAFYREKLPEATVQEFDDRGHFLDSSFPEILNDIKSV